MLSLVTIVTKLGPELYRICLLLLNVISQFHISTSNFFVFYLASDLHVATLKCYVVFH